MGDLVGGHGTHRGLDHLPQLGKIMGAGGVLAIRPGQAVKSFPPGRQLSGQQQHR
ncbi:MAG: hypothetical protein JO287_10745 [Pseudonocardiales bacterium]|nr:hypothetical protein [Pseudonocardiales bacterium]